MQGIYVTAIALYCLYSKILALKKHQVLNLFGKVTKHNLAVL